MKNLLTGLILLLFATCFSQATSELYVSGNFRVILHADGTARFTKNDEKIIDYLDLKWSIRNDTQIFYRQDSLRLVYLIWVAEDSLHRKVCHVDPMLYLQHKEKFPSYLRLSRQYDKEGRTYKEFRFEGKQEERPEFLFVYTYDPPPYLSSLLKVRLKDSQTTIINYDAGSMKPISITVKKKKRNRK